MLSRLRRPHVHDCQVRGIRRSVKARGRLFGPMAWTDRNSSLVLRWAHTMDGESISPDCYTQ